MKEKTREMIAKLEPEVLRKSITKEKKIETEDETCPPMTGVHTYNILSNKIYYERYMYMPCVKDNRKEFIISMYTDEALREMSCYVVRCASDLAYMDQSRAESL